MGRWQRLRILLAACVSVLAVILANFFGLASLVNDSILSVEQEARKPLLRKYSTQDRSTSSTLALFRRLSELSMLEQENAELRSQLQFVRRTLYDTATANVIFRDPLNHSLVYIDTGSEAGIKPGNPVVTDDGILIGKVLRTSTSRSLVEYLTSDSSRVSVSTVQATTTIGLLRGDLGSSMRLEYVISDAVSPDNVVVTSGRDAGVPRGLLIGGVRDIERNPNQLFAHALVEPLIDYQRVFFVTVMKTL